MDNIVNLRQARKARERGRKEEEAAENRAKFGRTKVEKAAEKHDADKIAAALKGAFLGPGEDGGGKKA